MQQPDLTAHPVRLSERLRGETAEAHHQLDSQTALAVLMQPELTELAYGRSLFCLYHAWAPAESAIEQLLEEHAAHPAVASLSCYYFPRRQALEVDLAELAWPLPHVSPFEVRPCDGSLVSPEAALAGQLYVIAGGQLGSVLIERRVSAANPNLPLRFFQARPADLGQRWAGFRACLDSQFASIEAQARVIESANRTFCHFIERLNEASRSALSNG
jgi:heme oxygenase